MTFSPQPLSSIIEASLEANKTALSAHPVQVTLPENFPQLAVDPLWLEKLLGHLLENAAKYSSPGAPIFISAELRNAEVCCSVADRGVGIDPMEQSLIFDKFYRARNRRQSTSGTGMGLAICRAIAEAHGGTIHVTSQPGKGSVFTFTLPRSHGAPA